MTPGVLQHYHPVFGAESPSDHKAWMDVRDGKEGTDESSSVFNPSLA